MPYRQTEHHDRLDDLNFATGDGGTDLGNGESVHNFNGNLQITHAASPTYPVDGGGRFGLVRTYNSNAVLRDLVHNNGQTVRSLSWVGIGWKLHMGRFFSLPEYKASTSPKYKKKRYYFETPTGALIDVNWDPARSRYKYQTRPAPEIYAEYFPACGSNLPPACDDGLSPPCDDNGPAPGAGCPERAPEDQGGRGLGVGVDQAFQRSGERPGRIRSAGARPPVAGSRSTMLSFGGRSRVVVSRRAIDLRKAHDGLCAVIRDQFGDDPFTGDVFAFFNRAKDRIKLLVLDRNGFWPLYKRLEKSTFPFDLAASGECCVPHISRHSIASMLRQVSRMTRRLRSTLTGDRIRQLIGFPTYRQWACQMILYFSFWVGLTTLTIYFSDHIPPAVGIVLALLIFFLAPDWYMVPTRSNYARVMQIVERAVAETLREKSQASQTGESQDAGARPPSTTD